MSGPSSSVQSVNTGITRQVPAVTPATAQAKPVVSDQRIAEIVNSLLLIDANDQVSAQDIRDRIISQLQNGAQPFMATVPKDIGSYYIMKAYANMLSKIGYPVKIPSSFTNITPKDLQDFVNALNNAIGQFTASRPFTPDAQRSLFERYGKFLDESAKYADLSRVSIVTPVAMPDSTKPVNVARIIISGDNDALGDSVYRDGDSKYVIALVDGRDPLYESIVAGKQGAAGLTDFGSEAFGSFLIGEYLKEISALTEAYQAVSKIYADDNSRSEHNNMLRSIDALRRTMVPSTAEGGFLKTSLTEAQRQSIQELYSYAQRIFGPEICDGRLSEKLGQNTGEEARYLAMFQTASDLVGTNSVAGLKARLETLIKAVDDNRGTLSRAIGALSVFSKPKEQINTSDIQQLSDFFANVSDRIKFCSQESVLPQTAEKLFVEVKTRGLTPARKSSFLLNLELIRTGILSYTSVSQQGLLGISQPQEFTVESGGRIISMRSDLVNFKVDADNPLISSAAGTFRAMIPQDTSAADNRSIVAYALSNFGSAEVPFNQTYLRPNYSAADEAVPLEFPAFSEMRVMEDSDLRKAAQAIITENSLDLNPETAFRMLKSIISGESRYVLYRGADPADAEIASSDPAAIMPDAKQFLVFFDRLLRAAMPSARKTDDVFGLTSSYNNLKGPGIDSISFEVLRSAFSKEGVVPENLSAILRDATGLSSDFMDWVRTELSSGNMVHNTESAIKAQLKTMAEKKYPGRSPEEMDAIVNSSYDLIVQAFSKAGVPKEFMSMGIGMTDIFKQVFAGISGMLEAGTFLPAIIENAGSESRMIDLNRDFVSKLVSDVRNRLVERVDYSEAPLAVSDTITVDEAEPLAKIAYLHPMLAIKIYLSVHSNAPVPVTRTADGFRMNEVITANDVNAFINMASEDYMNVSKSALDEEDLLSMIRARDYLAKNNIAITSLTAVFPEDTQINRDLNRTLAILSDFAENIKRLVDMREPLVQRKISQMNSGEEASAVGTLARNAASQLWHMPSFAHQKQLQNMVADSYVVTLKEQFFGKTSAPDTSIDADFIERFCRDYGSFFDVPLFSEIIGQHPENTGIKDPEQFLLEFARGMREKGEKWSSLNINAADYKNPATVEAKRLLQAAMMMYRPGRGPAAGGIVGDIQNNLTAAADFAKMLISGPTTGIGMDYASGLKLFLLRSKRIDGLSPEFSMLDNKVSQEIVNASGKVFQEFLQNFSTPDMREELIKAIENDPMNSCSLGGDTIEEKFHFLQDMADRLASARVNEPFAFSYGSYESGDSEMENALLVFSRSILPQLSFEASAGEQKFVNFGATLYSMMGGGGSIDVFSAPSGGSAADLVVSPETIDTELTSAVENQILYNWANFKFFMMPTIQLQMQTGMLYQLGVISKSALSGNPYAKQDLWSATESWVNTRAAFVAFHWNPLAWWNPTEVIAHIESGDYSAAAAYTLFFGPMALNMARQRILPTIKNAGRSVASHIDSIRGRTPFISHIQVIDALYQDPEFLSTELEHLESKYPELRGRLGGWLRSCRAAGRAVDGMPVVKNALLNPIDLAASNRWAVRVIEAFGRKTGHPVQRFRNNIAGRLIDNPQIGTAPVMTHPQIIASGLMNPSSDVIVSLATPTRIARFTQEEVRQILEGERTARQVLESKGFNPSKIEAGILDSIPDNLRAGASDIPLKFRQRAVRISGLDAMKIIADPANNANVAAALGVLETTPAERAQIVRELRSQYRFQTSGAIVSMLPQGGPQLAVELANGARSIDELFADDVLDGLRADRGGDPMFRGTNDQIRKRLADMLDNPMRVDEIRARITHGEAQMAGRQTLWMRRLSHAAQNPHATQMIRIVDSGISLNEVSLEMHNSNLLSSIASCCDPRNLNPENLLSPFASFDGPLFRKTLDDVYSTGSNSSVLRSVAEGMDDRMARQLDDSLNAKDMPAHFKRYFEAIEDPIERRAKMLLSGWLQSNIVGDYARTFQPGTIRRLVLSNPVQSVIRRFRTQGRILEAAGDAAVELTRVVHRAPAVNPPVSERPIAEPALARQRLGSSPDGKTVSARQGSSLPAPENNRHAFGSSLKSDFVTSVLLSGAFNTAAYFGGHSTAGEAVKGTAAGTGIGVAWGVVQRQALRRGLSPVKSFGAAGAVIDGGLKLYDNWDRVTSGEFWPTVRGLGNTALGGFNGAMGGVTFCLSSGTGYGMVVAIPASIATTYGLEMGEDWIAKRQWFDGWRSMSQFFDDKEIAGLFGDNNVNVEYTNPARNDDITRTFAGSVLLEELGQLLTYESERSGQELLDNLNSPDASIRAEAEIAMKCQEFRLLLSESGIKSIKVDASSDLNSMLMDQILKASMSISQNMRPNGVLVEVSAPTIHSFESGKIGSYHITFRDAVSGRVLTDHSAQNKPFEFDFQILIEGDPIATVNHFMFEAQKGNVALIDMLSPQAHFSIRFGEIGNYPKIDQAVRYILGRADEEAPSDNPYSKQAETDLPGALRRFLDSRRSAGPQASYFDSANNRLGTRADALSAGDAYELLRMVVSEEQLKTEVQKFVPSDRSQIVFTIGNLSQIMTHLAHIDASRGSGTISYSEKVFDPDVLQIQGALHILDVLPKDQVTGIFNEATKAALESINIQYPISKYSMEQLISCVDKVQYADPNVPQGWRKVGMGQTDTDLFGNIPDPVEVASVPEMRAAPEKGVMASVLPNIPLIGRWFQDEPTLAQMMEEQDARIVSVSPRDEFGARLRALGVKELILPRGFRMNRGIEQAILALVTEYGYHNSEISVEDLKDPKESLARIKISSDAGVAEWIVRYGEAMVGPHEVGTWAKLAGSDGYLARELNSERYREYLSR